MKTIITGGAGFIGSNLAVGLLETDEVVLVDNFSTGDSRYLDGVLGGLEIFDLDISRTSPTELAKVFHGCDRIFHLAANADVRGGWSNTKRDIDQNIIATHNVAEATRLARVSEVVFASTGCVYGDSTLIPTPENEPFPIQTSLYGMSKMAAEGIFSSYSAQGAFKSTILRFVSVLGRNYHHGHVIDFVRKLKSNPNSLQILGDGTQKKSYINVADCTRAFVDLRGKSNFEVFNIGHNYFLPVFESARLIARYMELEPEILLSEGSRGWIGDNPFTFLDISKAKEFGWEPSISIETSVEETVTYLLENQWVLDKIDYRNS